MKPTITTDIRSQLAELAARAEARDLRQRELDKPHLETIEVIVPAHWACPLVYGDYSGLSDDEAQEIDDFLASEPTLAECIDVSEDVYFAQDTEDDG